MCLVYEVTFIYILTYNQHNCCFCSGHTELFFFYFILPSVGIKSRTPNRTKNLDVTFDVPVDLFFRVQIVEPLQYLLQHGGDLRLVERTRPQLEKEPHTVYMQVKNRLTVTMCTADVSINMYERAKI